METEEKPRESGATPNRVAESLLKARRIVICEEINQKMAQRVVSELLALAQDSDEPITIFINSQGGHVEAGDTIHDIIKFIAPRVRVIGTGWVASAGTHIFLAADKADRMCLPNTRFLIHQPSGGIGGRVTDIAIQAQQIERMRERLAKVIADATGTPIEKVREDIERDHWMTTEEAIAYGILSRVVTSETELS